MRALQVQFERLGRHLQASIPLAAVPDALSFDSADGLLDIPAIEATLQLALSELERTRTALQASTGGRPEDETGVENKVRARGAVSLPACQPA